MSESKLSPLRSLLPRFNQTLKKGFEGLNGKMNDYNAFIRENGFITQVEDFRGEQKEYLSWCGRIV